MVSECFLLFLGILEVICVFLLFSTYHGGCLGLEYKYIDWAGVQ